MRRCYSQLLLFTLLGAQGLSASAATVTVGEMVSGSQLIAAEKIDHSSWNALLSRYVDKVGMVDYKKWKATPADVQLLDRYLDHLSPASFTEKTEKKVKLAFWINAYNAVTVQGILREYPTSSIRNHTAKVWGYNIWDDLQLLVAGKPYSLNDMEHKVLRKLGEPRIHFAIVCASIGCPRLLNEAYETAKLDAQLTTNAKHFFADREKFRVNRAENVVSVSPILDWFAEDFGKTTAEQLQTIAPYVPEDVRGFVASGKAEVEYLDYDWGLNDQSKSSTN